MWWRPLDRLAFGRAAGGRDQAAWAEGPGQGPRSRPPVPFTLCEQGGLVCMAPSPVTRGSGTAPRPAPAACTVRTLVRCGLSVWERTPVVLLKLLELLPLCFMLTCSGDSRGF